jgi:putative ABC transport system permease protein
MHIFELILSALTALRSNLLRTALTMLGIIIGIASVILIISLGQGATASITDQISTLGTNTIFIIPGGQQRGPNAVGSTDSLSLEDSRTIKEQIQTVSAVSATVSQSYNVAANSQNLNVSVNGVEPDYSEINTIEIEQGTFLTEENIEGNSRVAVVGPEVVTELYGEGAEVIGEKIKIDSRSFRIIGVTKAKGSSGFANPDKSIYIPITTQMRVLMGQNYVGSITAFARETDEVDETMKSIETLLLEEHNITDEKLKDFQVRSSQNAISTVSNVLGVLTALLTAVAAISLVVGGIGIMNIMLVTVTERTKEIGLLKSIGAKRKDILTQFLIESVVLTVVGGIIGMLIGIGLAYIIAKAVNIPFIVGFNAIAISMGVSSVVGIVFGMYPAQRAAKLNPIEALRFE